MATAFKCDRCKSLQEGNAHGNASFEETAQDRYRPDIGSLTLSHMCRSCYFEVVNFAKKKVEAK